MYFTGQFLGILKLPCMEISNHLHVYLSIRRVKISVHYAYSCKYQGALKILCLVIWFICSKYQFLLSS